MPADFVELPSTLFERMARDFRVLSQFAHNENGESIDAQSWMAYERLLQRQRRRAWHTQLKLAAVDYIYHSRWPLKDLRPVAMADEIAATLCPAVLTLHSGAGAHQNTPSIPLAFSHLVHYPAACHTYLVSEILGGVLFLDW